MKWIAFILFLSASFLSNATQLSLSYLLGERSTSGVSLTFRPDEQLPLSQLIFLEDVSGRISLEASLRFLMDPNSREGSDNVVLAFTPILSWQITNINNTPLYLDVGIGLSIFKHNAFAGKEIGTNFQFEDTLGLTYQVNKTQSVSLRYVHYSNGGFASPNPGLDFVSLMYSYRW